MPRDYQRKTDNPYRLPENLYKMVKYAVRDYDRIKAEHDSILHSSSYKEPGIPSGSRCGNPTEEKAIKISRLSDQLRVIDQALVQIPEEYRRGVFNEARYGGGFPIDASRRTYETWKQRFMFYVAENLKLN